MDAQTFRADISGWLKATDEALLDLAREACLITAQRVVERTNVDTGFLRSQWQPSIGSPDGSGLKGEGAISAVIEGMKIGDVFFMTNNTEYGPFVEYGTAQFEGFYFVTNTVAEFPDLVHELAVEKGLTT